MHTPLELSPTHLTPFIVGISGHMKLPEDPVKLKVLRERIRTFYRWLRADKTERFDGLGCGLGLKKTPVHVLSSLAPGVDQIAAEVAREAEFGFRIISPLPFPREQYLRSSTFTSASESEKAAIELLPDETFYVALAAELTMSEAEAVEAREKCLTGDGGKAWRYAHLRASGEYVAGYCDLLLAVSNLSNVEVNEVPEPPMFDSSYPYDAGTPVIVKVRRHGITPGLLPVEPALPWADVGPVVYLPWQKRGQDVPDEEGLFTFYVEKTADPLEAEAQREVVQEVTELVEGFNRKAPSQTPAHAEAEMLSMLGLGDKESVPTMPGEVHRSLLRIAGARLLAKNYNYARGDEVDHLRSRFLSLGLAAAVLLMVYSDWDPGDDAVQWVQYGRSLAFLAALGCGAWSLAMLLRFRRGRIEGDQIDSRCIAEGLRVQFYWTAAGTGVSVASNYLLRQRGAIRWIVNAVSAASSPYEPPMKAFGSMTLRERSVLLRKAGLGWIEAGGKKGQISFFKDKINTIVSERNHFQSQGWVTLFAGFILSFLLFLKQTGLLPFNDLLHWMQNASHPHAGLALILCGAAVVVGVATFLSSSDPKLHTPMLESGVESLVAEWLEEQDHLRPTVQSEWQNRALLWVRSLLYALMVAGLIVLIAVGVFLTGYEFLPTGAKVLTISKNILFALSARAALSSSLRFHTENFRNYTAMLSQFQSGLRQLHRHLATLELRCEALPPDATTDPEAQRAISAIQSIFLALGREALSEHAEWLHLRRDRPVSPNLPTP